MKNKTLQSFYKSFYGDSFARFFRRIPEFVTPCIKKEFCVSNPSHLPIYVNKFGLGYPCYISIYDYGNVNALKNRDKSSMVIDRVFFDFDVDNYEAKQIKKELTLTKSKGPDNETDKQEMLVKKAADLVINKHIAESAINQAKIFSERFKDEFSTYPQLFFSGFKGCHAYGFFEPVKLMNPNQTITYLAQVFKNALNLDSMDLSVNKDATSRLSRVPYSKHHITGLTVLPFDIKDEYQKIMDRIVNPVVKNIHYLKYDF